MKKEESESTVGKAFVCMLPTQVQREIKIDAMNASFTTPRKLYLYHERSVKF